MINLKQRINRFLGIDSVSTKKCEICEEKERFISFLQNEIAVLKKEIEIGSKKKVTTEGSVRKYMSWNERRLLLERADRKQLEKLKEKAQ